MAISFIDSYYSGHLENSNEIAMTIPGGAQADDVMIAYCHQSENTDQQNWDDDGGGGNGWTQLRDDRTTGGRDMETAIYYKVHSGSESNPTFTWDVSITEPMAGSMVVYRGVDTLYPPKVTYKNAQNSGNPPNPMVQVDGDNSTVICIHSQTHDDVTESAAPTGFTMRVDGWINSTADHMNHYVADITGINKSEYTPPDWQHTVANTTPEYHTYSISLIEPITILIESDLTLNKFTSTDLTITGFGFGSSQGSGKLELWSDTDGTIKVEQSIDSWAADTIQFDMVQGGLSNDSFVYLVVTNDSSEESNQDKIFVGTQPYYSFVEQLNPDIYYRMQENWTDTMGNHDGAAAGNTTGSPTYVTTPIVSSNTHSWRPDAIDTLHEINNSDYTNATGDRTMRFIGMWLQLDKIYLTPTAFWEEGGGVNNFYFAIGFGNSLIANGRDDGQWGAQSYGDFKLSIDRPYFVMMRFEGSDYGNIFTMYVNGKRVKQDVGELPNIKEMVGHSGGLCFNSPDQNLDTGGTDISYDGTEHGLFSDWMTFSDIGLVSTPMTDDTIYELFVRGVISEDTLEVDTEVNIQSALDTISPIDYADKPCGIEVKGLDGGGDLNLTMDNITFDSRMDLHIIWLGTSGETLTITVNGTTNIDSNFCVSPNGGNIVILKPKSVTVTGAKDGSKIFILDSSDDSEVDVIDSSSGDWIFNTFIDTVEIIIIHDDYKIVRKLNYTIADGMNIPIIQEDDYTYKN